MSKQITLRPGHLLAPQLDYLLVDGSQSMKNKWWDCLGALDNFMGTLRNLNVASHGVAHVFDTYNLESIQRDSTIETWKTFNEDPLGSTWGGTPLYDAINLMGRRLKELDPKKCSIVIVTFLGADFSNSSQAKLLGANEANAIGVRKELLSEAGKLLGFKRARHANGGEDINFSAEERTKFGGYLTHG